ncbi:MAG TPA: hypothetical protein PKI62_14385 [bacterium]|nr:hypothetical protein [bacterium]HPR89410.1 hypothetical protein [bacterium]
MTIDYGFGPCRRIMQQYRLDGNAGAMSSSVDRDHLDDRNRFVLKSIPIRSARFACFLSFKALNSSVKKKHPIQEEV